MAADPRDFLPLPSQDLQVLLTLAEGPLHAYALSKAVEAQPDGVRLDIGSLYRILARLTDAGIIEDLEPPAGAEGREARRRTYRLTPFGRRVAQAEVTRLEAVIRLARKHRLAPTRGGK